MVNDKYFSDLKEISHIIGNNLDLIQGAGGNTSLKDGDTLWIKASGCWLSDVMSKKIFISVSRNNVLDSISNRDIKNVSPIGGSSLRPSIETALHALMPHKYVIHTHAVNTLSIAILSDGKQRIKKLLTNINWSWVPYVMPGIELANTVKKEIENNSKPDVIILANHGLVVGGDTAKQAIDLLQNVENKMFRAIREHSINYSHQDKLLNAIKNSQYRFVKYNVSHLIAYDDLSLKIINKRALYPDHVVFLGKGPMKIVSIDDIESGLESLEDSVVIVRDFGVIVRKDISENAESMLYCLANVLLRLQPDDKLEYLTSDDEMKLMGWDAEKYRQSIQR